MEVKVNENGKQNMFMVHTVFLMIWWVIKLNFGSMKLLVSQILQVWCDTNAFVSWID